MPIQDFVILVSLGFTLVGFIITTITFVCKFVKAIKERNYAQAQTLLKDYVKQSTEAAEAITSKDGTHLSAENKLAYALNHLKALCAEGGIKFNMDTAVGMIDEEIAHTKKVNSNMICKEVNGVYVCEPIAKAEPQKSKTPFQSF